MKSISRARDLGPKRVESHSWKFDRGTDRELLSLCGAGVPHRGRHRLPPTQRVVVVSGDKVAMEPTLDEAIQSVFGTQQPQKGAPARGGTPELGQAKTQFDEAQKAMQQGDWETFGKAMEALKRLLTGPAQWDSTIREMHISNQGSLSMESKASLLREGARRTGPRRVRVHVRQVTGGGRRLGGVRPHVRPLLRLSPKCRPTCTGSMKRRSSGNNPKKQTVVK